MRKLASIQRIWNVEPIEGADNIELARVMGWQCVVKKGEFQKGDLCVYYEIDSFLPMKPIYEFLRSSSFKHNDILGDGYRLKTQKFKGQISQGLVLPLHMVLEDYSGILHSALKLQIVEDPDSVLGRDLTEMLGVRLWVVEERVTTDGTVIGEISSIGVPHTDETRIQSEPSLLEEFRGLPYYITTKMDGSSHSVSISEDGTFHVTGHNYEYRDDGKSAMYTLAKKLNVEASMREYMAENNLSNMVIQGELCAPGIQRNKLHLDRPHWYVFTVIEDGERMGLEELIRVCDALRLEMVPLEEQGVDLPNVYPSIEDLLSRASKNACGAYPGSPEGIVVRPCTPQYCKLINAPLSMKIINNKYLLKNS